MCTNVDRWYEDVLAKGKAKDLHQATKDKIATVSISRNRSKLYRVMAEPKCTQAKKSVETDSLEGVLSLVFN